MVEAIAKIRAYVTGHDSTSFASDGKVRDAVVGNLAVLGEAARSIPDDLVEANPQIPWRKMRAARSCAPGNGRMIVQHDFSPVRVRVCGEAIPGVASQERAVILG
jgi:hypothetical protein